MFSRGLLPGHASGEPYSGLRLGFECGYDDRTDYQLCLTDTPDSDSDSEDEEHGCHFGETRTDYQMCLTNMPDDEGDLSRSSIMSSSVNQNEENLPSEGF